MRINLVTYLLMLSMTSCFYGQVKINSIDRYLIPYGKTNQLIFINSSNLTDTIFLTKKRVKTSNFDFFIDKNLGRTNDSKKPYYESYSTELSLTRTFNKISTNQPYIKYDPLIFTFFKDQTNAKMEMFFNIDGSWSGSFSFDTLNLDSLRINDRIYDDVFIIKNDSRQVFEVEKIYWSIKHGLIRINIKNGEQWTLVNAEIK